MARASFGKPAASLPKKKGSRTTGSPQLSGLNSDHNTRTEALHMHNNQKEMLHMRSMGQTPAKGDNGLHSDTAEVRRG